MNDSNLVFFYFTLSQFDILFYITAHFFHSVQWTNDNSFLTFTQTPISESNVNNVTELLVRVTDVAEELDSYDVALATITIIDIVDFNSASEEVSCVGSTLISVSSMTYNDYNGVEEQFR